LFTAIIRDLSEEVEEASANEVTEVMCRWKIEKSAKVISLNKRLQDYVGVTTKEEELGADVFSDQLVHPSEYQESKQAFINGNKTMKGYAVNRRLKGKNGKYRWFNTQVVPVFDTKGEFRFWSGCCLDIEDLMSVKEDLKVLQDKLPMILWKANLDGDIAYGNNNFIEYTGIDFKLRKLSFYSDQVYSILIRSVSQLMKA